MANYLYSIGVDYCGPWAFSHHLTSFSFMTANNSRFHGDFRRNPGVLINF